MGNESNAAKGCRYKTGFFGGKFMPFHNGHLDSIVRCSSECEHLYVVIMHHGEQENELLEDYGFPFPEDCLDVNLRENAIRAQVSPLGNVEVLSYDCRPADERARVEGVHPWTYECKDMVTLMGRFDVAYSSEPSYSKDFNRFYPWADAAVLDVDRDRFPLSATMLRDMTFAEAYPHLPREYQRLVNRKVLVTGPESCGKTTLVRKLAMMLGTSFSEEQGRLACEKYKVYSPGLGFYPGFVHAQKEAERKAVDEANMVAICDSDAIVTAFYAEEYEGVRLDVAYQAAMADKYDLVFFVEPSVPWIADGLRQEGSSGGRARQSERMKEMYREVGYELVVLDGDYKENYERALGGIQGLLGLR